MLAERRERKQEENDEEEGLLFDPGPRTFGGADETRTRDLRRDRPAF
jgi:hypothetical protein